MTLLKWSLNLSVNLENSAVATGLEKGQFILIPKKGNANDVPTTTQLYSFHMPQGNAQNPSS